MLCLLFYFDPGDLPVFEADPRVRYYLQRENSLSHGDLWWACHNDIIDELFLKNHHSTSTRRSHSERNV